MSPPNRVGAMSEVNFNSYKNTMNLILTSLLGYNKIILKTIPTETVWIRFRIEGDNNEAIY